MIVEAIREPLPALTMPSETSREPCAPIDPVEARRRAREARRDEAVRRACDRKTNGRDRKRVRALRRFRRRVGSAILPYLAPPIMGLLRRSWRTVFLDRHYRAEVELPRGFLVALWHGRML